jgi:glycosyl transferase family 25
MSSTLADRLFASFDQVYIVNLVHRADRRDEMAGELARLGTSFADSRISLFEAVQPADAGPFRSAGARGCFMSHLGVLRDALAHGHRHVLLLEDDADFPPRIDMLLPAALDALDRGFGIFYGGYALPDGRGIPPGRPIARIEPARPVRLTHFMGFGHHAVERLVPYLELMLTRPAGSAEGGPMDVDGAYSWFRAAHPEIATWLARPQLGVQRPSRTDISPPGFVDRLPLPTPARHAIRAVRRVWRRRAGL